MAKLNEDLILRALRAKEGLFFNDQGLMTKEVAADRGLVHRSSFFWYTGRDPEPGSRSEQNRASSEP